jgi:oligoendopeptidase, pepF/M3 family
MQISFGGYSYMDKTWSLDELYTSFESDEFKRDYKKFEEGLENFKSWVDKNFTDSEKPVEKIEGYITKLESLMLLFTRMSDYAGLTSSTDARNEKALQVEEVMEQKIAGLAKPGVVFSKWLSSIDNLEDIISRSGLLKEHRFYLSEIVEKNKYMLGDKEEVIIARMKNTGSNAWAKLQNKLSSTLMVDITIDGEEKQLPISVVRNMAHEKDAALRKNAYEAELKSYKKIEESSAACLNGIKGEVITLCNLRDYSSPLDMTVLESRLDRKTLDAMLEAIKESLPSFRKYYRKKAEILGYKDGLPFYEIFAPVGSADMKFTYEDARDFVVKNFRTFSDALADFADNAFEKRWIDAEPRDGKRGGAFCANLHSIKESRVLANFTGSFGGVKTLAHELGHGYHGKCLESETYLNSIYTMPIAETASIFCETIVKNAALKKASSKEAFSILEHDLCDCGQVIVDIYSRFLFESELFKRRAESSLSVKELKEIMEDAQLKAYGDDLDKNFLHPYMWVNKPHYYYADANFYNFPYAFGLLFAKGLYAEYLKRGSSFIKDYDRLLSITGKNKIADVAATMGIDIHSIDFWRSSLKLIEEDIEKFISLK